VSPTDAPITNEPTSGNLDCEDLENLGGGFSEATSKATDGTHLFSGQCYPPIVSLDVNSIPGYDDSVAVFVGGDFIGRRAAEVEGNMVVLGDLSVESNGPGNFVSVGVGTHVVPNPGGDCIIVGGDISAARDIQVFNQASWMTCDIVYKGSATNQDGWKSNGGFRHEPDYDLSRYEEMKYVLHKKSQYWKTLPSEGEVQYENWGNVNGQTEYVCSNNNEVQVFNIGANEHQKINAVHTIYFSDSCEGKTVLINVHGSGDIGVDAAAMHFKGLKGYGAGGFSTCMTESILWNFPDAANVDLGNGLTSEFHGSILVGGNLKMTTSGHSGRTMVLGDVLHDSDQGSEFHTYQFNPPQTLPDPDDICEFPAGWEELGDGGGDILNSAVVTAAPTAAPTDPIQGCKSIPQNELPEGSWKAPNNSCNLCDPTRNGGAVSWYPCNVNPRICRGNCVFSN
jgi:choice-of-anchor A domain-containing protein